MIPEFIAYGEGATIRIVAAKDKKILAEGKTDPWGEVTFGGSSREAPFGVHTTLKIRVLRAADRGDGGKRKMTPVAVVIAADPIILQTDAGSVRRR